ncbi:MAG: hypothetical protein LIO58_04140, partial [Oscillospiraceae bacterium]|nr:hypothetical protein [Oscillospiraceae bacterium]
MKLEKRTDTSGLYRRQNVAFSGLDFTDGAEEGTLRDSAGISSARWPVLSTRAGRGQYSDITLTAPCAIYAFDKLCVIDDGVFYYGGEEMGYVDMGEKQFAVVGKKLCIWPDKKYLNLADPDNPVWGTLEASVTALSGSATFTDGTLTISCTPSLGEQQEKVANLSTSNYKFYYRVYDTVSFDPATGTWTTTGSTTTPVYVAGRDNAAEFVGKYSILDTDGYLQRRSNSTASAGVIEHFNTDGYYAKITSWEMTADTDSQQVFRLRYNVYDASLENETLTDLFSVGDGVTISGATEEDNNKTAVIRDITEETLTFDSNIFIEGTDAACVTVAREVPDLDFICEWNNRLWGVGDKTLYGSMQG